MDRKIKVLLMTTFGHMCGIAEYAGALVRYVNPELIEFDICQQPNWRWDYLNSANFDVLHVNYVEGQFGVEDMVTGFIRQRQCKSVITRHLSNGVNNRNLFTNNFTKILVHERTNDGCQFMPMPIPEVDISDITEIQNSVGWAGFPFPWKNLREIAYAANHLGMGCTFIAPDTGHADTHAVERNVREVHPTVNYIKEWLPFDKVVRILATQKVTVYAHHTQGKGMYIDVGSSSSVKMGVAAKRPIVVARTSRQFGDLIPYEDEIEFAESHWSMHLVEAILRVLQNGKRPNRICQEMGWYRAARLYEDIYKELVQ